MNSNLSPDELNKTPEDKREAYQAPKLKDLGSVSEITRSNGNNSGSDSSYS
ncbi:MAG: lasso RiPP family leader peptide-containing protein [Candidatus Riflebacteria bacterium]|nr:lasso RiPP family leader peptide-containing protein [Candidatus Riflebacteria bacterium]